MRGFRVNTHGIKSLSILDCFFFTHCAHLSLISLMFIFRMECRKRGKMVESSSSSSVECVSPAAEDSIYRFPRDRRHSYSRFLDDAKERRPGGTCALAVGIRQRCMYNNTSWREIFTPMKSVKEAERHEKLRVANRMESKENDDDFLTEEKNRMANEWNSVIIVFFCRFFLC